MRVRTTLGVVFSVGLASTVAAQDKVAKGAEIYAAQKCGVCHSIAGKGNVKGPLDKVGSTLSEVDIRSWTVDPKTMTAKTNAPRKPVMRAYPALPKDDLDALVAYMQSLK